MTTINLTVVVKEDCFGPEVYEAAVKAAMAMAKQLETRVVEAYLTQHGIKRDLMKSI